MDGETVARLDRDHSIDPFAEDFVKGAATRVVTSLNRVDHDRATFFARQATLSRFDPALGAAFLARTEDEALRARLRMGEALIAAERKFLAAQSHAISDVDTAAPQGPWPAPGAHPCAGQGVEGEVGRHGDGGGGTRVQERRASN